jgi:cyclopropane-fatty-acyl-phospholipid synthase
VFVKAFNVSHEQVRHARVRARNEGLDSRVEFIAEDYRNICGQFDAFVSIGMLEHVGREHYRDLGKVIHHVIGDSGRGLIHFIGRNRPQPFSAWIRKRIFPGAYAPSLREAMEIFEPYEYTVLDVENLRLHYAKTLEHWLARYERSADSVSEMFGSEFERAWRLYLAGSIAGFRAGQLQLFQVLFAGPARQEIPWTRADWYASQANPKKESQWIHAAS